MPREGVWQAIVLLTLSVAGLVFVNRKEVNTRLHWFVFSPTSDEAFTKLQDMNHRFGDEVVRIPSDLTLSELKALLYSEKLNSDDIVLISNSKSVMAASSQRTIRNRFLSFQRPIVFAGKETPTNKSLAGRYGILAHAQLFPYLNANLFIGRVNALRQFLANQSISENENLEIVLTNAIQRQPWLAEIDTCGRLFVTHEKKRPNSALEFDTHRHKVNCKGSGTHPCVIYSKESVIPFYAYFSV